MGYSTGISTSPSDLIVDIYSFAGTEGWTQVRANGDDDGTGNDQRSFSDPTSGVQFNLVGDDASDKAHIRCQPSTGDSGLTSTAFYAHPGSPDDSGTNGTFVRCGQYDVSASQAQGFEGTSVGYQLFGGANTAGEKYIHVVVEGETNVYWHLHMGHIEPAGAITSPGGAYVTALNVNEGGSVFWPWQSANSNADSAQYLLDNDNFANGTAAHETNATDYWHQDFGQASYQNNGFLMTAQTYVCGLQNFNQRTPFGPNWTWVWPNKTPSMSNNPWRLTGHTPDLRLISMDGRSPGETVTIGSDTWHIIPLHNMDADRSTTTAAYTNFLTAGAAPNNDSGLMGFAFKQNA